MKTSQRTLQIEGVGDMWAGVIKPKIRLSGHWLARAGFIPGNRVSIRCLGTGVLELRSVSETAPTQTTAINGEILICSPS